MSSTALSPVTFFLFGSDFHISSIFAAQLPSTIVLTTQQKELIKRAAVENG